MPPKKKKANVRGNKGGCKVGRKDESPKGGCKIGKRDPNKTEKTAAMMAAFQASRKKKVAAAAKSKSAAAVGVKAGDKVKFKKKAKKSEPTEYKRKVKVGTSDRTTRSAAPKPKPKPKGVSDRIKKKVAKLGKDQVKMKRKIGKNIEPIADKLVRESAPKFPVGNYQFAINQLPSAYNNTPKDRKAFQQFMIENWEDETKEIQEKLKTGGRGGGPAEDGARFNIKRKLEERKAQFDFIKSDKYLMFLKKMRGNTKTANEKKAAKAAAASGGGTAAKLTKEKPKPAFKPPTAWRKLYDDPDVEMDYGESDLTYLIDNVYAGGGGKMTKQHTAAAKDYKKFQQTDAFKTAKNVRELAKRFRDYVD